MFLPSLRFLGIFFRPVAPGVATLADFAPNLTQYKAYNPFHQPPATFQRRVCLRASVEELKFLVLIHH